MSAQTSSTYTLLMHLGLLKISGPDAAQFLQGQLTSNVQALDDSTQQLSALCDRKGRVLALIHVFRRSDDYYLILPQVILTDIQAHLQKFIMFSKAQIENVSEQWSGLAFIGDAPAVKLNDSVLIPLPGHHKCWQLWAPNAELTTHLDPLTEQFTKADIAVYLQAQMQACIPLISSEQTGQFLPQPFNLIDLGAVDFKKGCFVGQEIIARMHYRGQVKKQSYYATVDTTQTIAVGQDIKANDKTVGTVVNALQISDQQFAILAIIQDDSIEQPLQLADHLLTLTPREHA